MTDVMDLPTAAAPLRGQFAKRATILDAASRVFSREGFAGSSIDMIAAEAGVSRQTVYNHIGDKESLFAAVVEDTTEKANAGLYATLATFPDHPQDLEAELTAFARRPQGSLIVTASGLAYVHRDLIIGLTARHRLPSTYFNRHFVGAGGLMSYGVDSVDNIFQAVADAIPETGRKFHVHHSARSVQRARWLYQ